MATTFLKPIHAGKGQSVAQALGRSTDYVKNPDKTDNGEWISSYECNPDIADAEFLLSKRNYAFNTGKESKDNDVIAYHLRQSFKPGEITPEKANKLGYDLAMSLTKGKYAFIVCTHVDKHHIHSHIIFNSTNLEADGKFRNFWGSSMAIRRLSDILCLENGLSVIEDPKPSRGCYSTWLGDKKAPTIRSQLECQIDKILNSGCGSFDEFLSKMRDSGIEVRTGKHLAFKMPDGKRFIRCDSLSGDYSEKAILARIEEGHSEKRERSAGCSKENAFCSSSDSASKAPNLLIDIESKMATINSPGYEKWAKTYNLKEMAKTLLYLRDNDLADYDKLSAACSDASEKYNSFSEKTKGNEARMKEISELEKQIGSYGKTREVYSQYKSLPKNKQAEFYEEHRADLSVHEVAKKYFDSLGLEKLPSIKELKQEYATLNAENKKLYPEQKRARTEMIDLLKAKSNVERILKVEPEQEKEKTEQPQIL